MSINEREIVSKFKIKGNVTTIVPYGTGHINKTYLVETSERRYIFQIINSYAFKNVDKLMNNIRIVTEHLKKKGVPTLDFIPTLDGKLYYQDDSNFYRISKFKNNTKCYEKADSLEHVYQIGAAFGSLHDSLSDLDSSLLFEVVSHFHHTNQRYKNLQAAIKEDEYNKVNICIDEINMVEIFKPYLKLVTSGFEDGSIRWTVTHNDPKINNILFDETTNDVKCVIDLDTIMPGSVLYDFGDALRSLFTGENEDNPDPSTCYVKFDTYVSFLKGYYAKAKDSLTPKEIELLPYAPMLLSLELAMRFLEDYLRGNKYFSVYYFDHNLVRARTQLYLAKDILENIDILKAITKKVVGK